MDKLLIRGGRRLQGDVIISGAKNAALPDLCAVLLSAEPVALANVPQLQDVNTTLKLLANMGVVAERQADDAGTLVLDAGRVNNPEAPYELVKTMRASILVLGPLLARFGRARVSLPGGCAIGSRPVDQHIKGLQAMGAEIQIEAGYIHAKAKRLKGARIVTDMITVTGRLANGVIVNHLVNWALLSAGIGLLVARVGRHASQALPLDVARVLGQRHANELRGHLAMIDFVIFRHIALGELACFEQNGHLLGAVLMGVGGVTAMGCTIGQGLSGMSTLALNAFSAVTFIVVGAVLAMKYQIWRLERQI